MSDGAIQPETDDGEPPPGSDPAAATSGWDTDAFWVPTADVTGLFLAAVVVFFVLHFDELFGLHTSSVLVFGWLPINFAYHISIGIVHVAFVVVLYNHWQGGPGSPETEDGT